MPFKKLTLVSFLLLMGLFQFTYAQQAQNNDANQVKLNAARLVQSAIQKIYTLNSKNYQQQLNDAQQHFTQKGWQRLNIENSNLVQAVKEGRFSVKAGFSGDERPQVGRDPQSTSQNPRWIVRQPFHAIYQGQFKTGNQVVQNLMANALVVQEQNQLKIDMLVIQQQQANSNNQNQGES